MALGDPWTDERTDRLERLWNDGLSASRIAERMGGITRNAVIAKANRMKLKPRRTGNPSGQGGGKQRVARRGVGRPGPPQPNGEAIAAPADSPAQPDDPPPQERVLCLLLKPHHCRWPLGHPGEPDFGFCGRRRTTGSSYCAAHRRRSIAARVRLAE